MVLGEHVCFNGLLAYVCLLMISWEAILIAMQSELESFSGALLYVIAYSSFICIYGTKLYGPVPLSL